MESVQERMQRLGTKNKIAYFIAKEKEPYEFKRRYARIRAEEFARECDGRELNYHVSVGGLDSIVLYLFLHEILDCSYTACQTGVAAFPCGFQTRTCCNRSAELLWYRGYHPAVVLWFRKFPE